jgi:hypothetical protein
LDACLEFGAARLRAEWQILQNEGTLEAQRAAPEMTLPASVTST